MSVVSLCMTFFVLSFPAFRIADNSPPLPLRLFAKTLRLSIVAMNHFVRVFYRRKAPHKLPCADALSLATGRLGFPSILPVHATQDPRGGRKLAFSSTLVFKPL